MTHTPNPPDDRTIRRILFYDGECGLCTSSVRFFLRIDRSGRIQYAPLQGKTAQEYLPETQRVTSALSTVVYFQDDGTQATSLTRSHAVCEALIDVGGVWRVFGRLLRIVPTRLREGGYRFIAKHRMQLFPKGACALPTEDERTRLLD